MSAGVKIGHRTPRELRRALPPARYTRWCHYRWHPRSGPKSPDEHLRPLFAPVLLGLGFLRRCSPSVQILANISLILATPTHRKGKYRLDASTNRYLPLQHRSPDDDLSHRGPVIYLPAIKISDVDQPRNLAKVVAAAGQRERRRLSISGSGLSVGFGAAFRWRRPPLRSLRQQLLFPRS
jgi:hypothetical protein